MVHTPRDESWVAFFNLCYKFHLHSQSLKCSILLYGVNVSNCKTNLCVKANYFEKGMSERNVAHLFNEIYRGSIQSFPGIRAKIMKVEFVYFPIFYSLLSLTLLFTIIQSPLKLFGLFSILMNKRAAILDERILWEQG